MRIILFKNLILPIVTLIIGVSSISCAQDSLNTKEQNLNLFPALQSMLIPGWGQISQDQWLRGGLYLAGEAFLAADAYYYWENQYGRPGWDDAGRLFSREVSYGLAVWYGMGAVLCAADAYYFGSKSRTKIPTFAALQSALFPGWGQLANGQHWKAAGMFLLQTSLGFAAYYQHENYLFYRRQEESSKANFYRNDRNRLIWWSIGALIFSSADAFVDCHLRDWDVSDNLTYVPTYFPDNKAIGVKLQIPIKLPLDKIFGISNDK